MSVPLKLLDWIPESKLNWGRLSINPNAIQLLKQFPDHHINWKFLSANENDKILDTHLGSGSSRIAAHKAGLSFVGCEIDKEYFDASEKRYKQFISQLTLF